MISSAPTANASRFDTRNPHSSVGSAQSLEHHTAVPSFAVAGRPGEDYRTWFVRSQRIEITWSTLPLSTEIGLTPNFARPARTCSSYID